MTDFLQTEYGPLLASLLVVALALAATRNATRNPANKTGFRRAIALYSGYLIASISAQVFEGFRVDGVATYVRVVSYILFCFGTVRLTTSTAVWLTRTRHGRVTPTIMLEVVDGVLYLVAVTVVLRMTLKVDLGALLATPAILSLVFGLALQETLGNLFAGLSLQAEPPFAVGDWIAVGTHTGRVVQTTWRQTRIATVRNEYVTIPNSTVAKEHVVNYSNYARAGEGVARDIFIEVDYDSPPNAVKNACLEVMGANPRIRKSPAPVFRVSKWEVSGIQYQVRYFADDFADVDNLTDELLTTLWYRVRREGFTIPFPTRRVVLEQAAPLSATNDQAKVAGLLSGVGFFRALGDDGIAELASRSALQLFGHHETVARQGEPGHTFFLVVSGEVVMRADDAAEAGARLRAKDGFGEMSLLSDGPWMATATAAEDTVLLCVKRAVLGDVLRSRPGTARALSEDLAAYIAARRAPAAGGSLLNDAKSILGVLRDLFRLGT